MPGINVHGVKAHYADVGRGAPVVMVHAATNHGGQWDQVRSVMGGHYRYLLPDLFDSGRTAPWPGIRALTFYGEADILLGVLDAVGEAVHLAGHSYGGAVALRAVVRGGSRILSLCLIEPGGCPLLAAADQGDQTGAWRNFFNYYRGNPNSWDSLDVETQAKIMAKPIPSGRSIAPR